MLRDYVRFGLEHWGSDFQGVETTRRFLLEFLSFTYRYIPAGLLEVLPQRINERPLPFVGRNDLETLMASPEPDDWIKIRYRACMQIRESIIQDKTKWRVQETECGVQRNV